MKMLMVAPVEWGKVSVLLVEIDPRNSFIRAGADGRNTVQEDSSVQASL